MILWKDGAFIWRYRDTEQPEANPYAAQMEADLAARKAIRQQQQREATRIYWKRQRKRWKRDPLRQ